MDKPVPVPRAPSVRTAAEELARLTRRNQKLTALLDVAQAMTYEHNYDALLDLILKAGVRTVDAERGSLFLMDREKKELWSKIAQGVTEEILRLPVGVGIAGSVAATAKPLNIADAYSDSRFNRAFDRKSGFITNSVLCVPMLGRRGEVVGVLQVLNKAEEGAFTEEDEELLMAFGANAAAAIENTNLLDDIEKLFEGFVHAAVTAIESRDPTTSGHSARVADLSIGLMKVLPAAGGAFADISWSRNEIREMRYASLLHDFGKVGVREHVLVKADKLYPHQLDMLLQRFEHARRAKELELAKEKLALYERLGRVATKDELASLEATYQAEQEELASMLSFIRACNRPTVLEEGGFEKLHKIAERCFTPSDGKPTNLLTSEETQSLSIRRGSLNALERKEIESHVVHTYNFLKQIPWTKDLARIPEIAVGHHEKLDGTGYPYGIPEARLPVQTRIMTIADIYDALTASDRPYKSAMPHHKAIAILEDEAKRSKIDARLLEVFIEAEIPKNALHKA